MTIRTRTVFLFVAVSLYGLISPPPGMALLPQHAGFGCLGCHNLHAGGGGALLAEVDFEATCLSCHGPLGTATEVTIHDPIGHGVGNPGYVSCNECHNPHNNDRVNVNGGTNVRLVGIEIDYNSDPPVTVSTPRIREESPLGLGPLKEVVFEASPGDWGRSGDGLGVCNACHDATHNEGEDCRGCHDHNDSFKGAGCTGCHDGAGVGAERIGVDSPHSTNTLFAATGVTFLCEDCHTGHNAGTLEIPNNPTVGINYGSNGENGIALGGAATSGATEAEICWNCHALYGVSEWGLNSDTNGGESNFEYGSVDPGPGIGWYAVTTPGSEVGAAWSSANFGYKAGAIRSTHSVSGNATAPGIDPVGEIRCSYCHDVHELNTLVTDTTSGKPYLRGTWFGNPYREDGAPLATHAWTPRHWGNVPRGSVNSNEYGGYQIDQNNGYPTSSGIAPAWDAGGSRWVWPAELLTLADSAGLCTLCHAGSVDSMNRFDVDESGAGETPAQAWVGTNGHSNAVIGGTGSAAANIFRTSDRAPSGTDTQGANPDMGYVNHGTGVGYGFRGTDGRSFLLRPGLDGQLENNTSRPYGGGHYQWGAVVDDATAETQFHQFTCSKCHNPHASRLPRLMITNCLDTRHNTWDDPRAGVDAVAVGNTNNNGVTLNATSSPDNWGRTWSNTTAAQNCHRLAGDNRGTPVPGYGSGWNTVTPW